VLLQDHSILTLGLRSGGTTPDHTQQVTTFRVEIPDGKQGNELLSCGFAGLETVPPK